MDGVIIVRKEAGYTSSDVVTILRGILHMKRIGHTGTLDPQAEGVLPVCLGRATRAAELLTAQTKEYVTRMVFGYETDTQDTTGQITQTCEYAFSEEKFRYAVRKLTGEIRQTPPMYSAIRIDGQHLYDLARQGVTVERPARTVTIHEAEILALDPKGASLRIVCSKGTYIRTLVTDIGREAGFLASMEKLTRTRSGSFSLDQALSLGEIREKALDGTIEEHILPLSEMFSEYPQGTVQPEDDGRLRNGNPLQMERIRLEKDGLQDEAMPEQQAEANPGPLSESKPGPQTGDQEDLIAMHLSDGAFIALYRVQPGTDTAICYKMFGV